MATLIQSDCKIRMTNRIVIDENTIVEVDSDQLKGYDQLMALYHHIKKETEVKQRKPKKIVELLNEIEKKLDS